MAGAKNERADSTPAARSWLEDVARQYYGPLLAFFRKRTRNSREVQDLVQQVFLKLARYRDVERIDNPDAYIFQTAANALRDLRRRESTSGRLFVQPLALTADEDEVEADFSPERVSMGREAVAALAAAVRELPERTRDVFMLRCFEGLKHAEIAKLHGISVRAVEKHAARALAHLGERLKNL